MPTAPASQKRRFTTRVVKGSLWSFAGTTAPLAASFVASPIVIRQLGAEAYGVLALLVIIPQYLLFADLGMGYASTRFGSEAYAEGDPGKEARVIRTATLIAFIASIPTAILLAAFAQRVAILFNVPEYLVGEMVIALRFAAGTLVVTLLGSVVNSPELARLRMDLNTAVTTVTRIAGIVATPIVIHFGFGISGAAFVLFAAALINLTGHLVISSWLLPELRGLSIDRPSLRSLFNFGWPVSVANIASMAIGNLDRGALSAISSVTHLAYYSVAFTLASTLTFSAAALFQSQVPAFSQLQAEHDDAERSAVFSRTLRFILVAMLPVVAFTGIAGRTILGIFGGPEFADGGRIPLYILLIGVIFSIAAHTPAAALVASGRTDLLARLYWLELPFHVLSVWLLILNFDAIGAAVAWSMRISLDSVLNFILARRYAGVRFVGRGAAALAAAALVAVSPFLVYLLFDLGVMFGLTVQALTLPLYAFVVWQRVLEPSEATWLLDFLRAKLSPKA